MPRIFSRHGLWLAIFSALAFTSCTAPAEKRGAIESHHIHGVIQSLDAGIKTATIKHGDIQGFMSAMTMEFPVKDAAAFQKLHVGETIDGTVFVQDSDFWVGDIREVK